VSFSEREPRTAVQSPVEATCNIGPSMCATTATEPDIATVNVFMFFSPPLPFGIRVNASSDMSLSRALKKIYSSLIVYCSGSQTFLVRGPLKKIGGPRRTKYWFIILYRDSRTTAANLADHQWSAEQTLGITGLLNTFFLRPNVFSTFFSVRLSLMMAQIFCDCLTFFTYCCHFSINLIYGWSFLKNRTCRSWTSSKGSWKVCMRCLCIPVFASIVSMCFVKSSLDSSPAAT